jgi:hypothetical protein
MRRHPTRALLSLLLLPLGACRGSGPTAATERAPVAVLDVAPGVATVLVDGTVQLTAEPRDARHVALAGRAVAWTSSDTTVARVDARTGRVAAVRAGTATITATCEGKTGTATVRAVSAEGFAVPGRP